MPSLACIVQVGGVYNNSPRVLEMPSELESLDLCTPYQVGRLFLLYVSIH